MTERAESPIDSPIDNQGLPSPLMPSPHGRSPNMIPLQEPQANELTTGPRSGQPVPRSSIWQAPDNKAPEQNLHFTPIGSRFSNPAEEIRSKIRRLQDLLRDCENKQVELEGRLRAEQGDTTELNEERIEVIIEKDEILKKLIRKTDKLSCWESHIANATQKSAIAYPPAMPKAEKAENDGELKEIRKNMPKKFKEGMDINTFFDRFKAWVKVSKLKNNRLDEILLTHIEDDSTWRQLSNISLKITKNVT